MDWISYIEGLIITWGALGVFIGSIIEEVIVFIPSSFVQAGAGFFLLSGNPFTVFSFIELFGLVVIPATLGVTLGSLPVYYIAYYGGYPALRKWGKYFLIKESYVLAAEKRAQQKKSIILELGILRVIPIIPSSVASALAGILRVPFGAYILSTLGGVAVRALYLGIFGWFAGAVYKDFLKEGSGLSALGIFEGIILVIIVIWYFYAKRAKKKKGTTA